MTQTLQDQLDAQVQQRVKLQADLDVSTATVQELRVKLNDAQADVKQKDARIAEAESKLSIQDKEGLRVLLQKEELQREVRQLKDTI